MSSPKHNHRRCTVGRHATPTPERLPARGLARRDWREFNERKDWSDWPAGRGWPGIPRGRRAHGGRVCTAKGAAGGLDDVARIRAAEGRPEDQRPPPEQPARERTARHLPWGLLPIPRSAIPPPKADGVTGAGFALAVGFARLTDRSLRGKISRCCFWLYLLEERVGNHLPKIV